MDQKIYTDTACSNRKFESMVLSWGPSLYHRGLGHGGTHDSRTGIFVLGPCSTEISLEHGLCLPRFLLCHHVSVVLLGVFIGLLSSSNQWVHRKPRTFWPNQHAWCTEPGISLDPGAVVCILSGDLGHNGGPGSTDVSL